MQTKILLNKEEKLNVLSHSIGIVFGILGFFLLLTKNSHRTSYASISIVTYSLSLISMFLVSTLYHYVTDLKWKNRLQILDHITIYFLIAGTYTPLLLITLEGGNAWSLLAIVWGIAALGTVLKLFYTGKYEFISLLLYVFMGWLIVFDYDNLLMKSTSRGLNLLFIGGGFYTFGILFYAIDKIPYNHFIWHIFVLGGAFSHWCLMYFEVV